MKRIATLIAATLALSSCAAVQQVDRVINDNRANVETPTTDCVGGVCPTPDTTPDTTISPVACQVGSVGCACPPGYSECEPNATLPPIQPPPPHDPSDPGLVCPEPRPGLIMPVGCPTI